jgi:hypothetical protein
VPIYQLVEQEPTEITLREQIKPLEHQLVGMETTICLILVQLLHQTETQLGDFKTTLAFLQRAPQNSLKQVLMLVHMDDS